MKVDVWSSKDGHPVIDGDFSPSAGLASNALPEVQSSVPAEVAQKGVSTKCTLLATKLKAQNEKKLPIGMPYVPLMEERKRHTTI